MTTAFIDESMRQKPVGLYVVASVVVVGGDLAEVRSVARSVLLRGQPRFHWRAESGGQRRRMLDLVRCVAASATAHVCRSAPAGKEPRARAQCLKRLLWDLRDQGVDQLVFESRERHNDRKDRLTIVRAQQVGAAPKLLGYDFRRPHDEPLLWLADAVAGAVATREVGGDATYVDALGEALDVTAVDP